MWDGGRRKGGRKLNRTLFDWRVLGRFDFFGSAELGHFFGHVLELGAHVVAGDSYVDDAGGGAAHGAANGAVELALGGGDGVFAAADQLADFAVIPAGNGVEGAVADFPHGAVAVVVEDKDDGAQAQAHGGGELGAGHLECAVADEDDGPEGGVGDGDADG